MTTTDPDSPRAAPQDPDAEAATLGAMLASPDAIADVLAILHDDGSDYYRPAHEVIHATIVRLYADGVGVDPITVTAALTDSGDLARIGGVAYVSGLYANRLTTSNVAVYARRVRERAMRRRAAKVCQHHYQALMSDTGPTVDALRRFEADVSNLRPEDSDETLRPLSGLWEGALTEVEAIATGGGKAKGVPTGIVDLDELTNGLKPGQLIIVAARPACGKSTLGINFAQSAAIRHDATSVVFSLEMGRTEVMIRMLAAEARVPMHHMLTGTMTDDDWNRLSRCLTGMAEKPMWIDDDPSLTMPLIHAKCARLKQRHNLRLVVVDYLQLMSGGSRYEGNRQQEVSEISRSLKLMAKELAVPVVALSQLNRGPEQRADRKPLLSDLRESGALEQDADLVLLLHREDLYEKESPRAGEADIIVAKHRNGATGTVTVAFQGHYSRFVDMAA